MLPDLQLRISSGESMYRIPLLLGLLQITNLSLPITSPFTQASARYSMDGRRVTFEQIELRSKEMLMQGNGHLDFATKQVRLTFVTDSTAWPKLPIIGDLIQGARHELLQIHVKGTLQEPKVSAGAFGTVARRLESLASVFASIRAAMRRITSSKSPICSAL